MTQGFQKTPTWQSKDSDTPFTTNWIIATHTSID